jgi:hypothetical protein
LPASPYVHLLEAHKVWWRVIAQQADAVDGCGGVPALMGRQAVAYRNSVRIRERLLWQPVAKENPVAGDFQPTLTQCTACLYCFAVIAFIPFTKAGNDIVTSEVANRRLAHRT